MASAAEFEDHLRYRWYRVEVLVFAHDPALAAEQNVGTDGVAARPKLLDALRYPRAAFALAEIPDGRRTITVGRPPPVDDTMPLVVSNLVPPVWFAGECVTAIWTPRRSRTVDMLPAASRDPCLPPDAWTVESQGIDMAMDPGVPESPEVEPDIAPDPNAEAPPQDAPARPAPTLEQVNTAIAEHENELLRTSYVWRRETPEFTRELAQLRRRYQVIAAGSWHQPVPSRGTPQPLLLQVGAMDAERAYPLEGLVSVTLGRYVHFHATLRYRLEDGVALLSEQRRMRSDEPHYLDHPALGLLVRVDPLDAPEALLGMIDEYQESRDKPQ